MFRSLLHAWCGPHRPKKLLRRLGFAPDAITGRQPPPAHRITMQDGELGTGRQNDVQSQLKCSEKDGKWLGPAMTFDLSLFGHRCLLNDPER